ncbi:hypothetical protein FHS27_004761 [Rhodopirellula rubra]|uniref:Uncharacterized protein n=1 Tax=Aporhodopirellula rubra TaxID=980271 RepID=A0A7W5H6U0_9BACT|nr:hypothetical protein [Aporhodopirellula rubra]MBB3208927.1 hypothetical protein [Aporhodopirellula rubra]
MRLSFGLAFLKQKFHLPMEGVKLHGNLLTQLGIVGDESVYLVITEK